MKYLIEYGTIFECQNTTLIEVEDLREAIGQFWIKYPGKIIWKITTVFSKE